ncbi:MAG: hypothetical protein ABIG28_01305 [archaeon]
MIGVPFTAALALYSGATFGLSKEAVATYEAVGREIRYHQAVKIFEDVPDMNLPPEYSGMERE